MSTRCVFILILYMRYVHHHICTLVFQPAKCRSVAYAPRVTQIRVKGATSVTLCLKTAGAKVNALLLSDEICVITQSAQASYLV